ncbi:MAG: hypothetical protein RLZZ175_862 [Bacteroidota bacterium]|jgi:Xaa-Pro aminopeptidase
MRYEPINPELFVFNRNKLANKLLTKSISILNSNDVMPTNADGTMGFKQNSDLFYLSGIDQEETILLLYPDAPEEKFKEILFIRETSDLIATWEGYKLTKDQARTISGIKTVFWISDFDTIFSQLMFEAQNVYLNTNEHARNSSRVQSRDDRFIIETLQKFPLHTYHRLAPILQNHRSIKHQIEVELISKACKITEKGFRRLLNFVKPGVWEYEIEAEFLHEILINRSRGTAYSSIVASGANANILHYVENNAQCKDGDLILLDIGAEYANYHSDMSRTIPVNGKFNARQAAIYNAVLSVMKQATQLLVVGNTLTEYHATVGKIMEEELIKLGLLNADDVKKQNPAAPLYKKYFMHGTSHYLGLDTHDVGSRFAKFEAGMVFTCEPGIYIKEEGIGIRLENNFVINQTGKPTDLMSTIPLELSDIEDLMKSK